MNTYTGYPKGQRYPKKSFREARAGLKRYFSLWNTSLLKKRKQKDAYGFKPWDKNMSSAIYISVTFFSKICWVPFWNPLCIIKVIMYSLLPNYIRVSQCLLHTGVCFLGDRICRIGRYTVLLGWLDLIPSRGGPYPPHFKPLYGKM